ncbi:hypothetical protein [Luedemannella helvata]|uniref:Core-binding (CB) domain-containing protein n=1 Tax=Luedemannella helvata TaxID=349315 RepID=A0ABN2L8H9_9ACTN
MAKGMVMSSTGVIFKRCGCRNSAGQRLERRCRQLKERGHGSWYVHCSATNLLGSSERLRRGGFPSQAAARRARDEWLAATEAARTATGWTVQRWLRHWLNSRTKIRPTTRFHYTRDVEQVLIPYLGHYRLAQLDARLLRTVFAQRGCSKTSASPSLSASSEHHRSTTPVPGSMSMSEPSVGRGTWRLDALLLFGIIRPLRSSSW